VVQTSTTTVSHVPSIPVQVVSLACFAGATALVAWLGSLITTTSVDTVWFDQLAKPEFYPPPATFGIVWTILYIMIAAAGWLAWRSGGGWSTTLPWMVQLGLNLGWTALFFGAQLPVWAFFEIILLLAASIWTTLAFRHHDRPAMALFIPYVVWICFAAVLNGAIVAMN